MSQERVQAPRETRVAHAALLGLVSTGLTGLGAMIRSKSAALNLGVSGVGLIAEVQQLLGLLSVPAAALGGAALTRLLVNARASGAHELRARTRTAAAMALAFGSAAGVALVAVAPVVLSVPFEELGRTLLFASAATVGTSTLGVYAQTLIVHGSISRATMATSLNIVLGAGLTVVGTLWLGVSGYFLGQFAGTLIVLPVTLLLLHTTIDPGRWTPTVGLDVDYLKSAVRLGGASLAGVLASQLALGSIRFTLLSRGGHELNGLFQAAWALDSLLVTSITSGLGSYFFPRFAAASTTAALQDEVNLAGEFTLVFGGPLILIFGLLRHLVISLAYSSGFSGATELLGTLAIADTLKVLGWVAAGPLLYRNQVRAFVIADVSAAIVLAGVSHFGIQRFGLTGVGLAQISTYAIYLPLSAWLLRSHLGVRMPGQLLARGGALTFAVFLATTFPERAVTWLAVAVCVIPAILGGKGYAKTRDLLRRPSVARRS